jgi:hypothetical protein
MRNNLTQCLITGSPEELCDVLCDKKKEILTIRHVPHHSDPMRDLMVVTHKKKRDFVTAHKRYNIALSLFTTAAARVKLYGYMDQIDSSPYCRLLYTDTGNDKSVIGRS